MFKNRTVTLIVLAVLCILFLFVAYVIDAGAELLGEAQEGCLEVTEIGWSGTAASTADEWYEVYNNCTFDFDASSFHIESYNGTESNWAALPDVQIPAQSYCLFERTDEMTVSNVDSCGLHGSAGTGESLVGIFPNSSVFSFALFSEDAELADLHYHEMMFDGEWAAGSSSPRASMQKVGGMWITSNHGNGSLDADGNEILGTPGAANQPNTDDPFTCGVTPDKISYDLNMIVHEDFSQQAVIEVEADLWGVDENGNLIGTDGAFTFAWVQGAWVVTAFEYGEASNDCIDALEMLRDGTENILQGDASNINPLPSYWPTYSSFLNGVLQFQKSGLHSLYLPAVQK